MVAVARRSRVPGKIDSAVMTPLPADSFTRSDSSSSLGSTDSGLVVPWSALNGTWGIASNKAYLSSTTGQAVAVVDAGVSDATVSADITLSGSRADTGLVFRAIDNDNYLLVAAERGGSNLITVYKKVTGSYTSLGAVTGGLALGSTYNIKVMASGDIIKVWRNTTPMMVVWLSSTDHATFGAATKHGIRINCAASGPSSDDGATRIDNFTVALT